jgi:hypothetical protein
LWGRLTIYNRLKALGAEAELSGSIKNFKGALANSKRLRRCWDGEQRFMVAQGHNDFVEAVDSE